MYIFEGHALWVELSVNRLRKYVSIIACEDLLDLPYPQSVRAMVNWAGAWEHTHTHTHTRHQEEKEEEEEEEDTR
jgi:hypothetical protein